jgi:hypothetical protein
LPTKNDLANTVDAAKLATYGIGHCHGLSSVMAALLLPFCHVLGIYVRYCGGFHFKRHQAGEMLRTWQNVL